MVGLTIITAFILLQSRKIVEGATFTTTTATAVLVNGVVTDIIFTESGGSGYLHGTTITIAPPSGRGTTATAKVVVGGTGSLTIDKTTLSGGSNYTATPTVTITNGIVGEIFVEATATATVLADGSLTLNLDNGGAGYGAKCNSSGIAGNTCKGVTVTITEDADDKNLIQKFATATVTINKITGGLEDLKLTENGLGYKKVPTISFSIILSQDEQIKKITSSELYKESEVTKKKVASDLKTVAQDSGTDVPKAANDKAADAVPVQQVLQRDTLIKIHKGAPRMGTYDGLCLSGLTTKTNYHLVENDKVYSYMGVQYPPEEKSTEDDVLDGPAIDGDEDSPHKLSMFANNMTSINCCGDSPYVSSSGCICMTKKQKQFIQNRGLYSTKIVAEAAAEGVEDVGGVVGGVVGGDVQIVDEQIPVQNDMVLMDTGGTNTDAGAVRLFKVSEDTVGGGQAGATPNNSTGGIKVDPNKPLVPFTS